MADSQAASFTGKIESMKIQALLLWASEWIEDAKTFEGTRGSECMRITRQITGDVRKETHTNKQKKHLKWVCPAGWPGQHVDLVPIARYTRGPLPIVVGSSQRLSSQKTFSSHKKTSSFSFYLHVFIS